MISFCVTSRNRYPLFSRCVAKLKDSVAKTGRHDAIELIIADWGSQDAPPLKWVPQMLQDSCITTTMVQMPRSDAFSRGRGLNTAAHWARYDRLFFIDTDMLIARSVIEEAIETIDDNAAYFPICWGYNNPEHTRGRWRDNGKGIVALNRQTYKVAEKWDEFTQWGSEDLRFFDRVSKLTRVDRRRRPGLFHQWHPSSQTLTRANNKATRRR